MMLLRSFSARKAPVSQWICKSCRSRRYASSGSNAVNPLPLPQASKELRKGGPARTRFAPSPTGKLHLGSIRTALFNYLIARATGGQFVLRIEDTDQKRTISGAEDTLLRDLEWAGIEWDEGPGRGGPFGPYRQAKRTAIYKEHTEQLLRKGAAYRCFCTPERLHALAAYRNSKGLPPNYDRTCIHIHKDESDEKAARGEAYVVRLQVPSKYPAYRDIVYKLVQPPVIPGIQLLVDNYEDPILMKSDGFPTYHLANVVDDHLMKITHVIRGSEWMSSTPKHLAIYHAFGWNPPKIGHVSLLTDKQGAKLSKRNGSVDISTIRDTMGVFPETLNNFLALLGWSHSAKSDVMNMEELIHNATLKYTRGDTVVAMEKLWFLQKRHAHRYATTQMDSPLSDPRLDLVKLAVIPVVKRLEEVVSKRTDRFFKSFPAGKAREDYVRTLVFGDALKYTTADSFIKLNKFFFITPLRRDLVANPPPPIPSSQVTGAKAPVLLEFLPQIDAFARLSADEWTDANIKAVTSEIVDRNAKECFEQSFQGDHSSEAGKALQKTCQKSWLSFVHGYVRWAIFAKQPGPDGVFTMRLLGREECLGRFEFARKFLANAKSKEAEEEEEEEEDMLHKYL
ncbi:hypothetical protein HYALB_00006486 [Hymenoscyphus albidus]|uniref:Glutamate--tRNA ligase, mitochondrial n=1 Tax=Hymenoscyphus albidus TaxID=595503 RepID=A0A9N9LDR1_9HELO|nr:hypothetical protein HYALB_00006486 [Hymenoscyphus albidus]